ncbi:hypothetical protein HJG60_007964 [Phyllostomus discolor]|uniref:Uncharacterized protein n=1 Tax=Phyllostomus discolor TaxID=89673 RepID=A0A834BJV8_9CHIR|nr:hypothetical protein HJG60_007964 [Phyllostomus discolor]
MQTIAGSLHLVQQSLPRFWSLPFLLIPGAGCRAAPEIREKRGHRWAEFCTNRNCHVKGVPAGLWRMCGPSLYKGPEVSEDSRQKLPFSFVAKSEKASTQMSALRLGDGWILAEPLGCPPVAPLKFTIPATFYKWNHTVSVFVRLVYFTQYVMFFFIFKDE